MAKQIPVETLTIDNFQGAMTLYRKGTLNSGRSYEQVCSGQNPFIKPGELTWNEEPVQIDPTGAVITDLIVCGKERVEGNIVYVYAVGHTGRVYKIQVNDPNTYNPDYDNPVLLTTLAINSPTFKYGGFIDFYGTTERIYIGHDKGVTQLDFDGSNEAFKGSVGSWTQNVPRPLLQFTGVLYIGNGSNIAAIDSTNTVTSYTKLSPGFPTNSQVRDMDLNPDGTYIDIVVSKLPLYDITSTTQDATSSANSGSYIFKWNGTDIGYTSLTSFPSFSLAANILFQRYQYTFGTDQFGAAVYAPDEKIITTPEGPAPLPNAIASTGNLLFWTMPIYFNGVQEMDLFCWGSNDFEVGRPLGNWDLMFTNATSPETDIIRVPLFYCVSNAALGPSSNGYSGNQFSISKFYYSTLETSSAPTTKYRFYKWRLVTSTAFQSINPLQNAYYQTQTQMFSRKVTVNEVRIYGEPWQAGVSFKIDLIGSDGNPISNGGITLTAQSTSPSSPMYVGTDYAWYNPKMAPTYAIGLGITNLGTTNFVISKIEIDYTDAGK